MLYTKKLRFFKVLPTKWKSNNSFLISYYNCALITKEHIYFSLKKAESCRRIVSRFSKSTRPKFIFKGFFNYSTRFTKKSIGARMGRGKGIIKNTLAPIVKNSIIFMFKKIRRNTLFILRSKLQFKLGIQLGCIYDIFKTEESCGASSISKIHINF